VTATPFERPPEETKRLARWAGAAYLSLGTATVVGFFHALLVHDDLNAIARAITGPELRFRIGVVTDVLSMALAVPLGLLLYQLLKPVHKTRPRSWLCCWSQFPCRLSSRSTMWPPRCC
jgi:hypothetical protein